MFSFSAETRECSGSHFDSGTIGEYITFKFPNLVASCGRGWGARSLEDNQLAVAMR